MSLSGSAPRSDSPVYTPIPTLGFAPPPALVPLEKPPESYTRRTWALSLTVLLVLDLLVLGLSTIFQVRSAISLIFAGSSENLDTQDVGTDALWYLAAGNFVIFGLIPLSWVVSTRRRPWTGTLRYLGLHSWKRWVFVGVGLAGFEFGGVILLSLLLGTLPQPVQEFLIGTAQSEGSFFVFFRSLTWPVAIFIALTAGIGEEILFRGVLQRWIGVWGQALLFMAAHMGKGFPLQWVVALASAVVYGYLRKAGWSLGVLMVAHAAYDFILLGLTILFPTSGGF